MHGINPVGSGADRALALRSAQKNVCNRTEFRSNTKFAPTSPYAVLNHTTYDGIHHYYGRADTYYDIGQSFGQTMYDLLQQRNAPPTITPISVPNPGAVPVPVVAPRRVPAISPGPPAPTPTPRNVPTSSPSPSLFAPLFSLMLSFLKRLYGSLINE
jgi:hypothetical protein